MNAPNTAAGDIAPWTRTAEQRPAETYGEQVDVLFGSSDWGWPIRGMYTHWSDKDVAEGACRWQVYDQLKDRYEDYIGPKEPEPEFWMAKPKLPAMDAAAAAA